MDQQLTDFTIGCFVKVWLENNKLQSSNTSRLSALVSEWFQEVHVRTTGFFDTTVPSYSSKDFRSHFRLTRSSVEDLWNSIAGHKAREPNSAGRPSVPMLKGILITLWVVGNQETYRSVADRFDVTKSTVYLVLDEIRTLIIQVLSGTIKFPEGSEKTNIAKEFEQDKLLPGVLGAIDGSFIEIVTPHDDQESYFNRKKDHAIILQGVCGPDKSFMDCNIGWPGSVHDARVLHNSSVYQRATTIFSPHFYLIGDAAYPIRSWLMAPCKNTGRLTSPQLKFNNTLSKMRVVVEQAFALLKGRFRRLKKLDIRDEIKRNQTVFMCCILHNMCLSEADLNDLLETETTPSDDDDDLDALPDPDPISKAEGEAKRRWLIEYLDNLQ